MSPSDWTIRSLFVVALLLFASGCIGTTGSDSVALSIREVDTVPPQAAVTPVENETIQQSATLVNTISAVVNSNETEETTALSSREEREIRRIVDALPAYKGDPAEEGTYIKSGNTTVTVAFLSKS